MTKGNRKVPKVNIGGAKRGEMGFDEHFRYQREQIELKKQPAQKVRVNAYAKTIWMNIEKISEEIARPSKMIIKFFSKELSVQMKQHPTTKELVINGQQSLDDLEDILEKFVEAWVLCSSCLKPETYIEVDKKKKSVVLNCVGCRHVGEVPKLTTLFDYTLKNPPKINANKGQFAKHIKTSGSTQQNLVFLNDNMDFDQQVDSKIQQEVENNSPEKVDTSLVNHRDDVDHLLASIKKADYSLEVLKVPKNHVKLIKKTKKKFDLNGNELVNLVLDVYLSHVNESVENVAKQLEIMEPLLVKYLKRSRHRATFFKNVLSQVQRRLAVNPNQSAQASLMESLRKLGPFQLDNEASELENWLANDLSKL
mmetsp:Transcript_12097/g.18007  ORF Transcript_12097/g.18007 Transcript_12097/m.18007 type:complete len:366 (-) Transcript_12097:1084-2181(-)|eukprot:CAMPEP_0117426500 /NCGR_PEP_ID=MMETSP0758-20121206/6593_1 /TAXON_ID=63605 /ORGANISM="Percolomonas cosmopolitus, Strain AE-1 (ATCC 50343)" /LENGTH=365 /DNA_ID=CAMNT_0005211689 /DNA_START=146 /DNA_END=1243 /DNA_ORIENTATION=-